MDGGQPGEGFQRSTWENRGLTFAAAGVGLLFGWVGTSPAFSMGINWDAAAYAAEIASGKQGWSSPPWSSHYALGPLYVVGTAVARILGGSVLDGLRLLGSLALGVTAALIADTARRLCGSRVLAFALVLVWICSWGLISLVLTWEDNVLFLPFAAGAISLALLRLERWRSRDSVVAGTLVGAGSLVSWQAAVYLFPALYVCLCFGGEGRPSRRRIIDAITLLLGFLGVRVVWAVFYYLTSSELSWGTIFGPLFARPEPSYFPRGMEGWGELARAWRVVLRHVAVGVLQVLGPWAREGAPRGYLLLISGAATLLLALAAWALSLVHARRRGARAGHVVIATATALLLVAAAYVDLPIDKYKRYDFLPLMGVLWLAAALGHWRERRPETPASRARVLVVVALLAGQVTLALHSHANFRAELPTRQPPGYHGRGAETWFAFARRLRRQTPGHCGYVFAFSELRHARYQLEIVASLRSELPGAVVLGAPDGAATWRRPLPLAPPQNRFTPRACEWISPEARALLP